MAEQKQPQGKKGIEPLTGDDVPEIIRDADTSWLLEKIGKGETLTSYQRTIIIEDTRYRVGKKLIVSRVGAAYTLRELLLAGAKNATAGNPDILDDAALFWKLEATPGLAMLSKTLGKQPLQPSGEDIGEHIHLSQAECIAQIAQALRGHRYNFAVTYADEGVRLHGKSPNVLYIAALSYAHSAAKHVSASPDDRIAHLKRAIELFDKCLKLTAGIEEHAEIETNAQKKRLEILPMAEKLEAMRRKGQKK